MLQNFGQIFQCPLVNTTVTSYPLPVDKSSPMRILLISDTHLGASVDVSKAIDLYMKALVDVIKAERITHVCHLGDLVDGSLSNGTAVLGVVLQKMADLKIPVWAIGGNHDREFFNDLKIDKIPGVTPLRELAMTIESGSDKVFLAHDLANNYRVRDQFAYSFISWIKEGCKAYIKPTDWLVCGHAHTGLLSHASKLACVGQFSPEIGAFGYGVLNVNGSGIVLSVNYQVSK